MASRNHTHGKAQLSLHSLSALGKRRCRTEGPEGNGKVTFHTQTTHDDSYIDRIRHGKNFINRYKGFPAQDRFTNAPPAANAISASGLPLNPALLLNPKGYVGSPKPSPGATGGTSNGNGDLSDASFLDFQFTSPNDGTASSASTPSSFLPQGYDSAEHSHAHTPVNGFGTMFERMNNLQERTSMPQPKRRKVEAEENGPALSGFGNGGSGMLGQYVKDRREEAAKNPALQRVDTVDLSRRSATNAVQGDAQSGRSTDIVLVEDDGDIIEVTDAKEQEVCFGQLQSAKINFDVIPSPKPGQRALNDQWWPQVKIILNRRQGDPTNVILAKDHTRRVVGRVDAHTALGLSPLLDSGRLYLRTESKLPSRPRKMGEQVGQQVSQALPFNCILYGPRKSSRAVASHLLSRGLKLMHPTMVEKGIKYENPMPQDARQQMPVRAQLVPAPATFSYPQVMRTVEEVRSEVMGVFDSLTRSEDLPQMEPDARITSELLPHQKQGLYFMTMRERPCELTADGQVSNTFWRVRVGNSGQKAYHNVITGQTHSRPPPETFGGILADMMGLGKTLSILSLITTSLDAAEEWSRRDPEQPPPPPAPKKNGRSREFDVPAPAPLALTTPVLNSRATLLVCPLSTVANWEIQMKEHIKPGTFKYYIYHGPNRIKDAKKLTDYDLVITTYGSVSSELRARHRGLKGPHPLEEISWFRIALDEAHMIREQSTLLFKAICRLQANRRWAVTGTPVQNKLDDLAALLAFIRLKPFDNKATFVQHIVQPFKACDAEIVPKLRVLVDSVTLRRLKDKIHLPPRSEQIVKLKFSQPEAKLYKLFEQQAQDKVEVISRGQDKLIGGRTYIHILQSILRLRLISAHGKELLNDDDLQAVQGMTQESAIDLDSDDENDTQKAALSEARAYQNWDLMVQTANDSCVTCTKSLSSASDEADAESEREENLLGYISSSCFHLICPACKPTWDQWTGRQAVGACPVCQKDNVNLTLVPLNKEKAEAEHESHHATGKAKEKSMNTNGYGGPHTKTQALLEDLLKLQAQSGENPDEPRFKSVVFSGWTSHLDLIQIALEEAGIVYTRLDGKMTRTARTAAMDRFREDPAVDVILVSITAGGLGLNLTAGNNVYVMEPQYNPAAEAQAVDRVHRIGQKRPVRIIRYIMEHSIEEKMLALQDKKNKLANLSMNRGKAMDKGEAAKQKLMDLRSLFR
ncbi:putative SWI/SNF-related matrix-associated actin-dependent regulator of chromatin subfamily A member 3-like 1 [Seiridium cardinale]|uniref:SWI/SNF-related matrix-associated actin-dependent regulator of chromatin subfamily A member 3-like 1 n=1 Tax=Seiridium cardinale TaxID=138064 RepID=A0ABR2X996_9PEZI